MESEPDAAWATESSGAGSCLTPVTPVTPLAVGPITAHRYEENRWSWGVDPLRFADGTPLLAHL